MKHTKRRRTLVKKKGKKKIVSQRNLKINKKKAGIMLIPTESSSITANNEEQEEHAAIFFGLIEPNPMCRKFLAMFLLYCLVLVWVGSVLGFMINLNVPITLTDRYLAKLKRLCHIIQRRFENARPNQSIEEVLQLGGEPAAIGEMFGINADGIELSSTSGTAGTGLTKRKKKRRKISTKKVGGQHLDSWESCFGGEPLKDGYFNLNFREFVIAILVLGWLVGNYMLGKIAGMFASRRLALREDSLAAAAHHLSLQEELQQIERIAYGPDEIDDAEIIAAQAARHQQARAAPDAAANPLGGGQRPNSINTLNLSKKTIENLIILNKLYRIPIKDLTKLYTESNKQALVKFTDPSFIAKIAKNLNIRIINKSKRKN